MSSRLRRPSAGVLVVALLALALLIAACGQESDRDDTQGAAVVASTGYMADIVANVAGSRMAVAALIPEGGDPHSFQPTPRDASLLAGCRMVVVDVIGLAPLVDEMIEGTDDPDRLVLEAAKGLTTRPANVEEGSQTNGDDVGADVDAHAHGDVDPHFWLDPVNVLAYVENIRDALVSIDPEGAGLYKSNADQYQARLRDLDAWIREQVATIPQDRRLLVTNHESFGYFADRYEFTVVGAVLPSVATGGSPSAQQLAGLIEEIRSTGAPAIFLEIGSDSDLADQVARETGAEVVADLRTHTLGAGAASYIEMMRWNVERIVQALR